MYLWAIIVSLLILGIAYALGEGILSLFEEKTAFFFVILGFFVVYALAAALVSHWMPTIPGQSDFAGMFTVLSSTSDGF